MRKRKGRPFRTLLTTTMSAHCSARKFGPTPTPAHSGLISHSIHLGSVEVKGGCHRPPPGQPKLQRAGPPGRGCCLPSPVSAPAHPSAQLPLAQLPRRPPAAPTGSLGSPTDANLTSRFRKAWVWGLTSPVGVEALLSTCPGTSRCPPPCCPQGLARQLPPLPANPSQARPVLPFRTVPCSPITTPSPTF